MYRLYLILIEHYRTNVLQNVSLIPLMSLLCLSPRRKHDQYDWKEMNMFN